MPSKYYCDYCEKSFNDTPSNRQKHFESKQHQTQVFLWNEQIRMEELQKLSFQNSMNQEERESKKPICIKFSKTGYCEFGEFCKFSHSPTFFASSSSTFQKYPVSLLPPPEGGYDLQSLTQVKWGEGEYKWDGKFYNNKIEEK